MGGSSAASRYNPSQTQQMARTSASKLDIYEEEEMRNDHKGVNQ